MISKLAMLAKKTIEGAWLNGPSYDLATQAAEALESAQLLQSPETAAELERLRTELEQRTRDLADIVAGPTDRLTRTFAPTQALRADQAPEADTPTLVVYRAYDGAMPLGTYTNTAAARAHCEADARRKWPDEGFIWISDPDGGGDLVTSDVERPTGYVVTALTAASEYDPEADE
ncbi:hypothetical protein AB0I98_16995 [Streptomyces sp. NPDC050211]|uniref:hypothetical protein n=1 Tax=Streptomyces sp. NPDC050211 TaxID=3154932 RepID=UPI00343CB0DE